LQVKPKKRLTKSHRLAPPLDEAVPCYRIAQVTEIDEEGVVMMNWKLGTKISLPLLSLILALLLAPAISAQTNEKTPAPLTGKYEGTGKGPDGDLRITLDLVEDAGKFSGNITTPAGVYAVTKGQMKDGLLSLELAGKGAAVKLSVRRKDNKLVGELTADGKTGTVELARAAKDEISGVWEAVADAQGQPFPFTLTLKLDGEKVSGTSSSQLGDSTITSGTWKDGKLEVLLQSGDGQIALGATMTDGKLVGDYDYAGQSQGKWAGVRKKQ
jgi:hypothetical protein